MGMLVAFAAAFFFLHRFVSAGPLRPRFVALLGETAFRRLFAVVSFACLAGLWIGYRHARDAGFGDVMFQPPTIADALQMPIQLIAAFLFVTGVSTRNPTIAGLGDAVHDKDIVRGIIRVTRHPFLWGVSLFALGHMIASPSIAAWGFFGTLLLLASSGTVSIDAKRRRSLGKDWAFFAGATSNLPFVAIAQGRQMLRAGEIGWIRTAASLAVFLLLLTTHRFLFL